MSRTLRIRKGHDDVEVRQERLAEDARDYAELKYQEREYEARRKEKGQELLPEMQEAGRQKIKVDFDSEQDATVSVKNRERVTIDADRLKKAIGAPAFNKLTTPTLDEAKIEAAIQLGDLDPNVVASCTSESSTPYLEVRFTKKRKRAGK
jgi:hypothetical protein